MEEEARGLRPQQNTQKENHKKNMKDNQQENLKANAGGMGYRSTTRRALFINALAYALPQMMGNERTQPLWPSLADVLGADSFKKNHLKTFVSIVTKEND